MNDQSLPIEWKLLARFWHFNLRLPGGLFGLVVNIIVLLIACLEIAT